MPNYSDENTMTSPTFTDRKAKKLAKQEKWKATPPAIIQRPLRNIRNRTIETRVDDKGVKYKADSPLYYMAKDFARAGDGLAVKLIAKTLLAG